MKAASEVFLERGFERASLDEIVRRSGGSKSTIYSLFGSKQQLFFAILREAAENIGASAPAILPKDSNELRAFLLQIARGISGFVLRAEIIELYRLAVEASRQHPEVGALYYRGGPLKAQDDFAALLRRLHAARLVDTPDPELAARFFFGMLLDKAHLAMSLGQMKPPGKKEQSRLAEGAVEVFLRAFGTADRTCRQGRARRDSR